MRDVHLERPGSNAYRRAAIGFGLSAIGLGLLSADTLLEFGYILSFAPELRKLLLNPVWRLGVGGAITGLTFVASYVLWLRFDSPLWRRYSTLLLLGNSLHVALWFASNHAELGMPDQQLRHSWLRLQISQVLNWGEFACWIALFRELNRLSSSTESAEIAALRFASFPGLAALGTASSIGIFGLLTDWSVWPLMRVVWLGPLDSLMLATASTMLMLAACLQMVTSSMRAARLARAVAFESPAGPPGGIVWTIDHFDEDPWGIRAETPEDLRF